MARHTFALLLLLFATSTALWGQYTVQTVPNVKQQCAQCFVVNPDAIFTPQEEEQINTVAAQLKRASEAEMAVVALKSVGAVEATDFAQNLYNYWGIGSAHNNAGILLLLVMDQRTVRIHTGGGVEGVLPDAIAKQIIENTIVPLCSEGKYGAGFVAGAEEIHRRLTTNEALAELLWRRPIVRSGTTILMYYLMVAFALLIMMMWLAHRAFNWEPTASNNVRYMRLYPFLTCSWALALFFPMPMLLFALWVRAKRRKVRSANIACPKCSSRMRHLSEEEEDAFLDRAKQSEERVGSIDYDVWLCDACQNHLVLPYESKASSYTACPKCKARTYSLYANVVRRNPTQFSEGAGEKSYLCKHCGYSVIKAYSIAKLPVAVPVGGGGSRGGGGFSGGGSWGGGRSFGGGASGRF